MCAQALSAERPADVLDVLTKVSQVQVDPVSAVAPSADLVRWSRLGSSYRPAELEDLLAAGEVVELRGLLRTDGPLPVAQLPDTSVLPWRSSGWNNNKSVDRMLDLMVARGEVAVASREGRVRFFDLAERVYPDAPDWSVEESRRRRHARRLAAHGILRAKGPAVPTESVDVGEAGEEAVVEGVRGRWRVDPARLDQPFSRRLSAAVDREIADLARWLGLEVRTQR